MAVRYRIDARADLLIGEATGAFTHLEIIDSFTAIVEETGGAAFFKDHIFLIDEMAQTHNLDLEGLLRMKDSVEALAKTYPGRDVKTAVVVSDQIRGVVAKMWQALTEAHPSIGAHVQLFCTQAEAKSWLES